jgi:hypothetical protein
MRCPMTLAALSLIFSLPVFAMDTVKLSGASERTLSLLTPLKEEMKTKLNVNLETATMRAPLAVKNLVSKHVDGYTGPDPDIVFKTLEEKKEVPPNSAELLQRTQIGKSIHVAMLHPDNPTTALTKEQIKGILDGSITSWESINGQKEPLILVMPTDFASLPKTLGKVYGLDEIKATERVKDLPGQIRALKANPKRAITFNSKMSEAMEGILPKQLPTDSAMPLFLYMRKDTSSAAQKVFDFVKAKGILEPGK